MRQVRKYNFIWRYADDDKWFDGGFLTKREIRQFVKENNLVIKFTGYFTEGD